MNKPVAVPEPGRICVVNGAPQKSFLFHLLHRRMPEGWSVVGYEEGQNLDVDRIVFLWLAPDFHALRPDVAFNRGEAHITNAVPMDVRQRLARGDALSCFTKVAGFRARVAWGSGESDRLRGGRRGVSFRRVFGGVGSC